MKNIAVSFFMTVIFSLSVQAQFKDSTTINHPAAAEDGLTRIDADGNYIYDAEHALTNQSFGFKIGYALNPDIGVEITQVGTGTVHYVHFDDMYDGAAKLSIGLDYEYFFFNSAGRLGLQGGVAFQFAQGRGRLASDPTEESIEKFTFVTAPITLGLVYRFEYKSGQYVVPYVSGGGSYVALFETRDDKSSDINAIGSFGFYGAIGGLVNLTAFSREFASEVRGEYGISQVWVSLEYRLVNVESVAFGYDNGFVQGGITFDY